MDLLILAANRVVQGGMGHFLSGFSILNDGQIPKGWGLITGMDFLLPMSRVRKLFKIKSKIKTKEILQNYYVRWIVRRLRETAVKMRLRSHPGRERHPQPTQSPFLLNSSVTNLRCGHFRDDICFSSWWTVNFVPALIQSGMANTRKHVGIVFRASR